MYFYLLKHIFYQFLFLEQIFEKTTTATFSLAFQVILFVVISQETGIRRCLHLKWHLLEMARQHCLDCQYNCRAVFTVLIGNKMSRKPTQTMMKMRMRMIIIATKAYITQHSAFLYIYFLSHSQQQKATAFPRRCLNAATQFV